MPIMCIYYILIFSIFIANDFKLVIIEIKIIVQIKNINSK